MDICTKFEPGPGHKIRRAPTLIPMGLIIVGLVLLPFDCLYNQALALLLIAIGGFSLFNRLARYICLKCSHGTTGVDTQATGV